jgi:hypothetical protein
LLYYNHNEIISFVGLLKNILVYSCIFANKIALYTNVVCPNTLNMQICKKFLLKKSKLKSEKIRKIWKKSKLKREKIWEYAINLT